MTNPTPDARPMVQSDAERARAIALSEMWRAKAQASSDVQKMMSQAKSLRQHDCDPPRVDLYFWPEPQQTLEWETAEILRSLATPTRLPDREAMLEEIATLKQRGAEAVIAYHIAICSPKGVVPNDDLYDPVLAARVQGEIDAALSAGVEGEGCATPATHPISEAAPISR
ncbi:MAG: hypothetical protein JWR85_3603 [Marmoricola sp.]|nr:hypothetical protein [Marmoricola sp.]